MVDDINEFLGLPPEKRVSKSGDEEPLDLKIRGILKGYDEYKEHKGGMDHTVFRFTKNEINSLVDQKIRQQRMIIIQMLREAGSSLDQISEIASTIDGRTKKGKEIRKICEDAGMKIDQTTEKYGLA